VKKIREIISKSFESFGYFYRQIGYRVIVLVALSILVGLLDGFGLTMFLPLLEMVGDSESVGPEGMGKMRFVLDFFQQLNISVSLVSVLVVMIVFFLFKGIALFLTNYYRVLLQRDFIRKIRLNLIASFNRVAYKYYVNSDVGRIQNTFSGEVERVSLSFLTYFRAVEQAILVAVYMGFAFFVEPTFALLVTVGGWLTNFLYKVLYKYTKQESFKFTKDSNRYQGQIIQYVHNFKYLKATALIKPFARKLEKSIDSIETSRRRMGAYNAILAAAREPMLITIVSVVILIQALVLEAPLGPILISLLFFYRALTSLMQMQIRYNRFLEVSGSLRNTKDFQEELSEHFESDGNRKLDRLKNGISASKLSFSYGEGYALKDINLEISKNESVAFVGESGSGKTTLVNILAGLMPIEQGELRVDKLRMDEIDHSSYQSRIGYITQEPAIFNDTIYNNVTFWAEETKENRLRFEKALRQAAIYDFMQSLPDREKTLLGNNGVNLSGGQKQRISIARELYKDIDILIMDEATSALDTGTERAIQDSIDAIKGEYTILIVAHRLSTIRNVDRIVLMKEGHIESSGSYAELIEGNSSFKRMVELQEL
jgi:ABC-type multidrug transport system fused ATPase/permease subunit